MDLVLRAVGWMVFAFGGPALALWVRARWGRPAAWLGLGALTWGGAQALRLPLLMALSAGFRWFGWPAPPQPFLFNWIVLSLSAGLFEETARWLGMRWAARRQAREGRELEAQDAVVIGLAHGGTEAFALGLAGGLTFLAMAMLREGLLPTPPAAAPALAAYWATPAWMVGVGILERAMAILFHAGLALILWHGLRRRQGGWWAVAVLLHAGANGTAGYALARWGVWAAEGAVALWTLPIAIGIARALRRPAPPPPR